MLFNNTKKDIFFLFEAVVSEDTAISASAMRNAVEK